jgi:hypothetical protein
MEDKKMETVSNPKNRWLLSLFLIMLCFSNLPAQAQNNSPVEPNFAAYYEPWEFETEPNTISYELPLDPNKITNFDNMVEKLNLGTVTDNILQNGFVVIEHEYRWLDPSRADIFSTYLYLYDEGIAMYITSDTLLHMYHLLFDEILKETEEQKFYPDMIVLTEALLNDALQLYDQLEGDLKEAARRNVAYLSVAAQLIGSSIPIPAVVSDEVSGELSKIQAHVGFAQSDIFIYDEDYSQYIPRGHYPRSDELKKYFKTMMWYGRMAFLLKGHENWGPNGEALISLYDAKIQTLQACLLAISLNNSPSREIWDQIYIVTAFYVGLADDLTPYDYLWALNQVFGQDYAIADLNDPNNFLELKTELALLPSPQIFGGTGSPILVPPVTEESLNEILDRTKGMRFMGQRFVPDSYMFQHLVYPEVLDYTGDADPQPFTCGFTGMRWSRCYPRGLDVMALLGCEEARYILIEEGDTEYDGFWEKYNELEQQFNTLSSLEWNRNLYWGWLYSLKGLMTNYGDGYPAFMQTSAWSRRFLNTSLASWTALRHDTILYAKPSYGGIDLSAKPHPPRYLEPVPEFFGRLLTLTRMTRIGLSEMEVLSEQDQERLTQLEEILNRLIEIAIKELTNQPLSSEDTRYLEYLAENLLSLYSTTGVDDSSTWTTLVADVHTCPSEGMILEEGSGKIDLIVVACPQPDGSAFLAAGPVLSYYEFKHPMEDRLTDEKWRELLNSSDKPERPTWYQPFVISITTPLMAETDAKSKSTNAEMDETENGTEDIWRIDEGGGYPNLWWEFSD